MEANEPPQPQGVWSFSVKDWWLQKGDLPPLTEDYPCLRVEVLRGNRLQAFTMDDVWAQEYEPDKWERKSGFGTLILPFSTDVKGMKIYLNPREPVMECLGERPSTFQEVAILPGWDVAIQRVLQDCNLPGCDKAILKARTEERGSPDLVWRGIKLIDVHPQQTPPVTAAPPRRRYFPPDPQPPPPPTPTASPVTQQPPPPISRQISGPQVIPEIEPDQERRVPVTFILTYPDNKPITDATLRITPVGHSANLLILRDDTNGAINGSYVTQLSPGRYNIFVDAPSCPNYETEFTVSNTRTMHRLAITIPRRPKSERRPPTRPHHITARGGVTVMTTKDGEMIIQEKGKPARRIKRGGGVIVIEAK